MGRQEEEKLMKRHAIRIYQTSIIISFIASCLVFSAWMPVKSLAAGTHLTRGQKLPDAELMGKGQRIVRLNDLKGRVKILSMVPQLNTPVCDEQTHRFSENNGGLDQQLEIVTIVPTPLKTRLGSQKKRKSTTSHSCLTLPIMILERRPACCCPCIIFFIEPLS